MRAAVLVLVLAAASSSAHASGIIIPPMEVDLGETATFDGHTESQVLAGLHWASLSWKPTPIEIGIGYLGISRDLQPTVAARTTEPSSLDTSLRLDGGYLTLGKTIARGHHWRTWFLARGELLHGSTQSASFSAMGGALRIATELYGSGAGGGGGSGGGGVAVGTFAVGVYVEAAHRDVSTAYGPDGFSSGITVRIPFIIAGT